MGKSLLFTVAFGALFSCESIALGQGMGGGRGQGGGSWGAGHSKSPSDDYHAVAPSPPVTLTPHGGEFIATKTNQYELVFMPLQARIYLFDDKMKPLTARDAHAQMSFTVPQQSTPQKILLSVRRHVQERDRTGLLGCHFRLPPTTEQRNADYD